MKKGLYILTPALLLLTLVYPVGTVAAYCAGYRFTLVCFSAFSAVIAALSLSTAVLCRLCGLKPEGSLLGILFSLLTPLAMINGFLSVLASPQVPVMAAVFLSVGFAVYLTAAYARPLTLRCTALILSVLLLFPMGLFAAITMTFGTFGKTETVKTLPSPDGKRYAQVLDSDQGALGGNTHVEICEPSRNAFLFSLEKKPRRIYTGAWGESDSMQIYWTDNTHLMINGAEYETGP